MADSSEQSAVRARRDSAGDHAVRFEDVTKRHGDVVAIDDVSFDVDGREFLTLLGPSGAGKSTLLHMIAGFTQPTEGEIYIEGEPVSAQAPYERNIGMVFQSMALFPHKTVHGNIAFPLKMRRHDPATIDDRVAEMLDLVRLPGIEDRRIDELSGGQQQRIAIARALAFEPSLLLLDEPLSSLDKKLREEMRHEITRIHDETDVTTIHVTHNQEEALTMADRIAVINEGTVAQLADTTTLYRQPATSFVADFVGSTNIFSGEVTDNGTIRAAGGSLELAVDLSGQRAGDAVEVALRHEQIRIDEEPLGVENEYEATVVESVFRGDLIDYRVDIDGLDTDIEVSQLNAKTTRVFEAGDVVRVGWARDDVLVYSR